MKLTKTLVDKLACPKQGQAFYRDSQLKGFAVRVTPGAKSFIVETRINGKVRRITLGQYGELTAEQARLEAKKLLGRIATGHDPIADKKESQLKGVTLAQTHHDYT
jgi:hypothetical protein